MNTDKVLVHKYASDFSIPVELAQIVAQRFPEYNEAKEFLFPDAKCFHNPKTIPDIESAGDVIIESVNKKEKILIYCHDDPDGYTSAAVMYKTLKDLYRSDEKLIYVYPIIRERDGYILNPNVLEEYKQKGIGLLITVDFGISSRENIRIAHNAGLKFVICDHHETNSVDFSIPAVDPKRTDSKYPFRDLAGVGVTFKLAQFLYQKAFKLKPDEFYNLKKDFFPLVMIGTISDRVTLQGENRIFCSYGRQILNSVDEPWIKYFIREQELNLQRITGEIIPVVASAAYLDPNYGIEILISDDAHYVFKTIEALKKINIERKQGVELLFKEVAAAAKVYPNVVLSVIPFSKQHYLGSVTARLKDYYKRTSVVIGIKDDKCLGELRSNDINLYKMLVQFQQLFLDFGGHKKACGFTMPQQNLDALVDAIVKYLSNYDELTIPEDTTACRSPAIFLEKANVNILSPLAPFGEGNPAPLLTDGINIYTIDNSFNIIEKG